MSAMTGVHERLTNFLAVMQYKLELRKKRPPDPKKWPLDGVDENGDRDWTKCHPRFLMCKLDEEVDELIEACGGTLCTECKDTHQFGELDVDIATEAADVALVAFMIAEKAGVDWDQVLKTVHRQPGVSHRNVTGDSDDR